MEPTITDWVQAIASVFTLAAAIAAVVIATKAPRLAAEFAEEFRRQNSKTDERDRLRFHVLLMLVRGRKQLLHQDTISALNIVDVAFSDVPSVRGAHRLFVHATTSKTNEEIVQAYHELTVEAARAIGLGDELSRADMLNGYYPIGLGQLDEAALAEAEEKIARRAETQAKMTEPARKK
jgi:hypothetical protein